MKMKILTVNAIIAALYVVLGMVVAPISFMALQFRLPEIFNHLIVFNKKYFWGIIIGVFIMNLFFSGLGWIDLVFGVGQSVISLLIMIGISKYVKGIIPRMIINTILFSITMVFIAWELFLALDYPFLETWLFASASELIVMGIGIPLMYILNKRLNFRKMID
ncbi:QueT transporter family protein [Listeria welshimeri]|uniref:QueT transporter family protein n=2 Tax=Listeria welshimeri TaxID=1643 RepID=A0A7X0T6N5_LISWE|nr:QueT transporter family protein [Listeria welshimeri]MBC1242919.1 QueT transporter family protein [Listeria welshimeri]MBC1251410.1 QueT transporter family protein [Listeria welshimeri]MBC1289865.1 QueT transporter family protein [Listeria welshimeri]MBC1323599.1 QueT transporter family protein [Listeria welshimeri]MBC1339746.1 QueT transporter family protein [Listeria welshimeri]